MLKKHIFAGLCVGFFAVFFAPCPLGAATVSVLVMESGPTRENQGGQYPILWENGLLEILFDSGHIVSNSHKLQIDEKPDGDFPPEAEMDFNNAREGGMDYFLIALIDYSTPLVLLRLFDIRSTKMVLEQKHAVTMSRNNRDEIDKIKTAARVMAAQIR